MFIRPFFVHDQLDMIQVGAPKASYIVTPLIRFFRGDTTPVNLSYFRPFLGAPCSLNIYNSHLETPNLLDMIGFPDVRRSGVCAVHWR